MLWWLTPLLWCASWHDPFPVTTSLCMRARRSGHQQRIVTAAVAPIILFTCLPHRKSKGRGGKDREPEQEGEREREFRRDNGHPYDRDRDHRRDRRHDYDWRRERRHDDDWRRDRRYENDRWAVSSITVSSCCPPLKGSFLHVPRPFATHSILFSELRTPMRSMGWNCWQMHGLVLRNHSILHVALHTVAAQLRRITAHSSGMYQCPGGEVL